MLLQTAFAKLQQKLREFCSSRTANVAVTFALASLPVIGSVATAVDYSNANAIKAKLQASLDSTALKLSKEAATDTADQLQTSASRFFSAIFNPPGVQSSRITANYSANDGTTVIVNGSTSVPTSFLGIFGIRAITVTGTSTAKWGSTRLRVALVLDNTGSMQQAGKMAALKTAASNFLTQLQSGASTNGDIYVSIIPFTTSVNVGPENYAQSWLDWRDYGDCTSGGSRFGGGGGNTAGAYTQTLCKAANGTWSSYSTSQQSSWTGCVTDRGGLNGPSGQNYDTNVTAPGSSRSSKYPAVDYDSCPQEVIGLSYNWPATSTLINNMQPNGNTNQNIGLQLGWMSLVGGGPFTVPPAAPGYNYTNIIVLFTDGLNTEDRWYSDQASIDARQTITCNNIQAAGITLYTVQISTDGTPSSTLLQNCATDATKYFYLTSSSQLVTTFSAIGNNLTNLRLAR